MAERELLESIAVQSASNGIGMNLECLESRHARFSIVFERLERSGVIGEHPPGFIRINISAYLDGNMPDRKGFLQKCEQVYVAMRKSSQSRGGENVSVEELSSLTGMPHESVSDVLYSWEPLGLFKSWSSDPVRHLQKGSVSASSPAFGHITFDGVLEEYSRMIGRTHRANVYKQEIPKESGGTKSLLGQEYPGGTYLSN